MDRKAIVQGFYKKLKIREIATLSKCGLATVQRTKNYLQDHNIPFEEAIEFTESKRCSINLTGSPMSLLRKTLQTSSVKSIV